MWNVLNYQTSEAKVNSRVCKWCSLSFDTLRFNINEPLKDRLRFYKSCSNLHFISRLIYCACSAAKIILIITSSIDEFLTLSCLIL